MNARALDLGTLLIALYCAVWSAFAPLIPQLHQAFAKHNHVFCSQHHLVEDAGLREIGSAVDESAPSTGAHVATTKGEASSLALHSACAFSNFVVQVAQTAPTQQSVPVPLDEQEVKLSTGVDVAAVDVLLLAPKHSPPLTA